MRARAGGGGESLSNDDRVSVWDDEMEGVAVPRHCVLNATEPPPKHGQMAHVTLLIFITKKEKHTIEV